MPKPEKIVGKSPGENLASVERKPGRKPLPLGWFALLGPLSIVLFVGFFEEAEVVKERSYAGSTVEARNHNTLGKRAFKEGNLQEAYAQFMTALKIQPDNGDAYLNLGILFQQTGKFDMAISHFQKALEFSPEQSGVINNNLGMVYGKLGRHDEAMAMFYKALETKGGQAGVHRNIGAGLMFRKDYAGAAAAFTRAIEQKPTVESSYWEMLQEAEHIVEDEADRVIIREALEAGIGVIDLTRFDAETIERYALRDPKIADDYLNLAQALFKSGDIDKAIENCRTSISLQPGVSSAHNRLGIMLATRGDYAAAARAFGEALRLDPQNDEARSNLEHCRTYL